LTEKTTPNAQTMATLETCNWLTNQMQGYNSLAVEAGFHWFHFSTHEIP